MTDQLDEQTTWTQYTAQLPASVLAEGTSLRLGFRFVNDYFPGKGAGQPSFMIDDVRIGCTEPDA